MRATSICTRSSRAGTVRCILSAQASRLKTGGRSSRAFARCNLGIALGALLTVMIHELTGGAWGFAVRRPLEAAIGTLPVVAALGLPLALGLAELFPWARPGEAETGLAAGRWYLDPTALELRALVYFALWIALSVALGRFWRRGETNAGAVPHPALRALSI